LKDPEFEAKEILSMKDMPEAFIVLGYGAT
jgi:hypothetical protein